MPNLQALAAIPSFGSQLGAALGGGLQQGISGALSQMLRQKQESQMNKGVLQGSLDRLSELSSQIGYSALPISFHGEESAGNRAEFESQKASLIAALRDQVNKGVLTNRKFDYIVKDLLPSHGDRKVVKERKLKAIAEQLELQPPALESQASSRPKDSVLMKDPSGTLRRVPKSEVRAAQKEGYKLER